MRLITSPPTDNITSHSIHDDDDGAGENHGYDDSEHTYEDNN